MSVAILAMLTTIAAAPPAFAQGPANAATAAACPEAGVSFAAYDVVSVKPVHPERILFMGAQETPDGLNGEVVTVAMLVQSAYGAPGVPSTDDSVRGLPDWAKGDYFSVQARMSPDQVATLAKLSKAEQRTCRQAMMQALLADRFQLKVHRETKQVPDYELVVAKGGPKMTEGSGNNLDVPNGRDGKPITGSFLRIGSAKGGTEVQVRAYSMEQVANFLTQSHVGVDHRVVDKTQLSGKYSFTLDFSPAQGVGAAGEAAPSDVSQPSIFTALQEQLGLKLQPGSGTVDVVVVEHVERPAAN
jgi:uncharacterized protein (TIGR03435 family)